MTPVAEKSLSTVEDYKEVQWFFWDAASTVAGVAYTPFSLLASRIQAMRDSSDQRADHADHHRENGSIRVNLTSSLLYLLY